VSKLSAEILGLKMRGEAPGTVEVLLALQIEALEACCEKVNAIRNSIVGCQQFNFSEHAYPLVAALNAAGFVGEPYPAALASVGTLLERATNAERKLAEVRVLLDSWPSGVMMSADEVFAILDADESEGEG